MTAERIPSRLAMDESGDCDMGHSHVAANDSFIHLDPYIALHTCGEGTEN